MRTTIAVVIVLLTGIASAAWLQVGSGTGPAKVSVVAASASGATVTVEIPGVQTESVAINGVQYVKLAIPGAVSAVLDVGKPEVPAVPVLLARPTGSTVTLTILSIKTETLDVARVYPMQRPLKYDEHAGPLTVDNSFYASDVEYPTGRLSSPRTATWRDLDVVNVHVYPVAVRPAQHQVIVTSRIKFRVDFSGGHYPARVTSWMVPMYRRLVQNYGDLRFTPLTQEPPGTKCLVFCHDDYFNDDYKNPALVSLLDTLTKLGDSTEIITVGDGVSPGEIKSTIIARYISQQPPALRWVLLVGECDEIPPKPNYTQLGWGMNVPYSDYWYSDWGLSNDTILCDDYPEVGIARLSVNSNQDLSDQIAKILTYMMGTDADDWLTKTTFVAHKRTEATDAVRGAAQMSLGFYPDITRDTIFGYKGASNTDVKGSIETGTGVLFYVGNGRPDGTGWLDWNTADEDWTNGDVLDLENTQTPVVFNIACDCGNLSQGTCLSEQWMRKHPDPEGEGAVASFGCCMEAWVDPANTQCTVAVRATGDYWPVPLQGGGHEYSGPVFDLGGIQMLMSAYVATLWPPGGQGANLFTMNIYSFMWLGNSAMPIWSGGVPATATVSYPSRIPTGHQDFTVTVTMDNQAVEGAQVCVYKPGDFYVVGLTEDDGKVTLTLDASSADSFYVSASKGHEQLNTPNVDHTPMLPYFGKAVVSDSGLCSTPDMTYPNWSRKLVRDPASGILHLAYTASNMVCYKQSTDDGATWSTPETVGPGMYPAVVSLGWSGLPSSGPWVVYLTPEGSIMRAIRMSPGSWNQAVVFLATEQVHAGAPSAYPDYVAIPYVNVYVAYPIDSVGPLTSYSSICFNVVTQATVSPRELVDGPFPSPVSCYGASVVANPAAGIHVCWIRDQSVYYNTRTLLTPWSMWPIRVSSPVLPYITEPASNPSMEAWGDSVFCAWRGPNDNVSFPGDVWRRAKWLSSINWDPATDNKSSSPNLESDFPVVGTYYATFWHEEVTSTNYDPWLRRENHMPEYLFRTSQMSRYPHVYCYFPTMTSFTCDAVWTEQVPVTPPKYEVRFGSRQWSPLSLAGGNGELASYYEVKLGQPTPSPYCLSRGGYADFDSWNADTSRAALSYQLPYLDPRMVYMLRAILYHKGKESWDADIRCDSGPWHRIRVGQNVPDTFWLQVPKALYKDGRIVVDVARAGGDYVSLAGLKLYQLEPKPDGREGAQSTASVLRTRLLTCAPSPFTSMARVSYELGQAGSVALTVHDVSGRLVRRLESGYRSPGKYEVSWDATDDHGRRMRAGIYFLRFSAGGQASSRRVTLVR